MTESASQECEALLSQAGWVRALARHLTADAHAADDLAQDALAAALARPPPTDRPLRSWLGAIVRNLARRERRSAGSRSARERAVARGEADGSSAELLERLESHRAVVEAVARLEEPYRTATLMRYFEGLSPAAIAARTEVPLRTVHTRLHRALEKLRADLDRTHGGDRRAWLLALIPFARGSGGWTPAAIGALVMDAKLKVALVVVALVGVCSTFVLWPDDTHYDPPAVSAAAPVEIVDEGEGAREPERSLEDSSGAPVGRAPGAPGSAAPVTPAAPAAPAKLAGRVLDSDGAPVAAVQVRFIDPELGPKEDLGAETDARGYFELERPDSHGLLDVASPGWTAVFRPEIPSPLDAADAGEFVLVVARSVALSGVVVDEQRHAIGSADLFVSVPFGLRARFDAILDRSSLIEHRTKSDADGRFELKGVPLVEGANLATTHAEYLRDERSLPPADELGLEIVLRTVSSQPARLVGTVVDRDGQPVEGAWIGLGGGSTKSGTSGAFSLDLSAPAGPERVDWSDATSLRAVKQGFLPGVVVRAAEGAWPDPLIVVLGGPPLAIEGRVVDAEGQPVAHALVWTDSEERFGFVDIEGGEMAMQAGANVEGILRGDPWTRRILADSNGAFELKGLLPKDYRVHALDKERLLATTASFAAGVKNVEIRMPKEDLHERVAGRVTSLSGEPIEGLGVTLERAMAGVQVLQVERIEGFSTKTDAEGRFAFQKVSYAINSVNVAGEGLDLMGFQRPLRQDDDVEKLELAVPMRVHVQVDGGERPDFDEVSVLDEKGEKLYLSVHHGHSAYAMQEVQLQERRTETFSVTELGKTLVLYKGKAEVRRVPLKLVRGELNTIRP